MQADAAGRAAASAAALGAALDAAIATVEGVLEEHGPPTAVSEADASAVAELMVRGLASADAGVACRAAAAIARFAGAGPAAGRAVVEASGGAAMPALARLATSGDGAAAGAAIAAVSSLAWESDDCAALLRAYAATDGAVEAVVAAVMQQAESLDALRLLMLIIAHGEPQVAAQVAAADGLCARLVSFVAAIGDDPQQREHYWLSSRGLFAMACISVLVTHQPQTAAPALMAAEGFWPAVEAVLARAGSSTGAFAVRMVLDTLLKMAKRSTAAARHAAGRDGLLAGLAAALTRPECRARAESFLEDVATYGKAAVAIAVARVLAAATDEATREHIRDWLYEEPMMMETAVISALEQQAQEAAALRARLAEFEAIPVNTRAAIVELAQAVRSKRRREEEAAAGEEQQHARPQKQKRRQHKKRRQQRD